MHNFNDKVISLARIDLNLFRVFAMIYKERNLTRASEQLFLSQPAVSHALSRLREHFDDPLFIRDGHGVVPSTLAKRLWPQISEALNLIHLALQSTHNFEPERDLKQLTIAMNDEFEPIIFPRIVQWFSKFIPDLQVISVRIDRKNLRHELSSGRIDFAIDVTHTIEKGIAQERCMKDKFVIMCQSQHPILKQGLSKDNYLTSQHITVSTRPTGRVFEDFILSKQGLKRLIRLRCQQYETAIKMLAQSQYLLTISNCQALHLKKHHADIEIRPLPINIEGYEMNLYWDDEKSNEQETIWCKTQLLEIMKELQALLNQNNESGEFITI
ncbi:LysR family transcriptional regulator [Acinetobacter suaedae]|uniref:LysR family transcriptional regulator n=1 Tax=Acinetobacter suaedae TaxID=2609668 RepID=A0A5P1UYH7_9GAMM|nr:LysR family transcriptional regulator [Acinetobacter sp. C16S1]QER41163.1 LysR family transcriptional regulator [Acinetobacter sp. C16S1]